MNKNYDALYNKLIKLKQSKLDYLQKAKEKFHLCAKAGLLKHAVPQMYGGYGDNFDQLIKVYQSLGNSVLDTDILLSLNAHVWGALFPLVKFGNEEQKKYISKLLDGSIIAGQAITENKNGSDITNMHSNGTIDEENFIINAHKKYITNAPIADMLIVYVKNQNRIIPFIIKKTDINVDFSQRCDLDGFPNAPIGEVKIENSSIAKNRLLGDPRKKHLGVMIIQYSLELERAFLFSGFIGIMEWQIQQVVRFCKDRKSKEQFLYKNPVINHKIAKMRLKKDVSSLLIKNCTALKDNNKRITLESSETKLFTSEAFLQNSLDAVQIMGGYGLETETNMLQLLQDAAACQILSGTSEIQLNIIGHLTN